MKIILLEDVVNLGHIGDVVEVKAGYARNYLIPKSMAILATAVNIAYIEKSKAEYVAKQNTILEEAKARLATIQGQVFTITAKAGVDGKLFGSVGVNDIIHSANLVNLKLHKSEIKLIAGSFKTIGTYDVTVVLHHALEPVIIKVNVIAQ